LTFFSCLSRVHSRNTLIPAANGLKRLMGIPRCQECKGKETEATRHIKH
jgi:hypothetical protein